MNTLCIRSLALGFLALSSLCFAQSEPSVSVGKIVFSGTPHIEAQQLNNMPHIDYVLTTGKFAWAVDENRDPSSDYTASAIFFDGTNWSTAGGQNIPGMKVLFHLYPAYPISGVSPYAWAEGANAAGFRVISYFNGQTWSPAKLSSDILNLLNAELHVSGGRAYFIGQIRDASGKPFNVYTTMNATSAPDQNWSTPAYIPGNFRLLLGVSSFNDNNAYLFLLNDLAGDGSQGENLVRINPDNSNTVINLQGLSTPYSNGKLLVSGMQIYVSYTEGNSSAAPVMLAYNGTNGDGEWTYIKDISSNPYSSLDWSEQYQSLICEYPYDSLNQQLSLGCVDFNASQPVWTPRVNVASQLKFWYPMTSNNSSWISYIDHNSLPQVLHYNFKEERLDNLNYPRTAEVDVLQSRVVNDSEITVCSWDKVSGKTFLYLYNLNQAADPWKAIAVPASITGCGFSSSGDLFPQTRNIDLNNGEQMWLYNYTGDRLAKK